MTQMDPQGGRLNVTVLPFQGEVEAQWEPITEQSETADDKRKPFASQRITVLSSSEVQ